MGALIELTGQKFGKLFVLGRADSIKRERVFWNCQCDCGNITAVMAKSLRAGKTKSCGCLVSETVIKRSTKHGQAHEQTSEYTTWKRMKYRCTNEKSSDYERYGGKGIAVCERWQTFENFFSDMGPKPSPNHSIDRIDCNGNYEPSNCRWATNIEQARNTGNRKNNTKGIKGVGWKASANKWRARISINGKSIALGHFDSLDEAIEVRKLAEAKYW